MNLAANLPAALPKPACSRLRSFVQSVLAELLCWSAGVRPE